MSVDKQAGRDIFRKRGQGIRKGSNCPVVEPGKLKSGNEWDTFLRIKTHRLLAGRKTRVEQAEEVASSQKSSDSVV